MPSTTVPRDHNIYNQKLRRNTDHFTCRYCKECLLPKDFEKHCSDHHNIDSKTNCVWCNNYSWPKGTKFKNASHLICCSDTFFKLLKRPPLVPNSLLLLLNMQHKFLQKTLYDFDALPTPEYEFLWPLESETPLLTYIDDNLNLAASYVLKFQESKDTHDWLHVMVKAVAFESFVRALNEDQGTCRTLLFSCWCNGGPYDEAWHRQHRHLIVVAPKGHFERHVWPKVRVARADRPSSNFPCKGMERILSPMHLVNTLGYLSHRKSQCKFTAQLAKSTPFQMHHFYHYRTLPIDYRLPLALLWDGGLKELMYQEKFQNVSVRQLAESSMTRVGNQWRQKIKHFYGHERGLVLPVSRRFVPCEEPTPYFVHLLEGRKLFFRPNPENETLDQETWMRKQARGGNCFYDNVEHEMWIPRPADQAILTDFKPVVDRNKELEAEIVSLKRKYGESENAAEQAGGLENEQRLEASECVDEVVVKNLLNELVEKVSILQ